VLLLREPLALDSRVPFSRTAENDGTCVRKGYEHSGAGGVSQPTNGARGATNDAGGPEADVVAVECRVRHLCVRWRAWLRRSVQVARNAHLAGYLRARIGLAVLSAHGSIERGPSLGTKPCTLNAIFAGPMRVKTGADVAVGAFGAHFVGAGVDG
jgi:hypothetical protein